LGKLEARHAAWHRHVGEDERDLRSGHELSHSRRAVLRLDDLVAEAPQPPAEHASQARIVLDDENRVRSHREIRGLRLGAPPLPSGVDDREVKSYARALSRFAVDLDVAAGLLDESIHHAEAE